MSCLTSRCQQSPEVVLQEIGLIHLCLPQGSTSTGMTSCFRGVEQAEKALQTLDLVRNALSADVRQSVCGAECICR